MKFLRMRPGHGEQLIAEGDPEIAEDEERLIEMFRRQLDDGMWAAIPTTTTTGRREAEMVRAFEEIPRNADRVIFFPALRAARSSTPLTVALCATAIVVLALLWEISLPWLERRADAHSARKQARRDGHDPGGYDPGRERRAEQRARELLHSCVNEEEWAMYRDLGFLRVWGGQAAGPVATQPSRDLGGVPYAYLICRPRSSPTCRRPGRCSTSTASSSRTRLARTAPPAFRTPTTSSPSGWRCRGTSGG